MRKIVVCGEILCKYLNCEVILFNFYMLDSFIFQVVGGNYIFRKNFKQFKELKYSREYIFKQKILGGWMGEVLDKFVNRVNFVIRGDFK